MHQQARPSAQAGLPRYSSRREWQGQVRSEGVRHRGCGMSLSSRGRQPIGSRAREKDASPGSGIEDIAPEARFRNGGRVATAALRKECGMIAVTHRQGNPVFRAGARS